MQGEKEVLRPEGSDPASSARNINIRQFAGMPLADLVGTVWCTCGVLVCLGFAS